MGRVEPWVLRVKVPTELSTLKLTDRQDGALTLASSELAESSGEPLPPAAVWAQIPHLLTAKGSLGKFCLGYLFRRVGGGGCWMI